MIARIVGHGPDLALIHGWGLGSAAWEPVVDTLAQRCRVHLIDLPGYGATAASEAGFVHTAQALVDALPAGVTLCGWSLGAMLALQAARLAPQKIARLILVGGTPSFMQRTGWPAAQPPDILDAFAEALRNDPAATLQRFIALLNQGDAQARPIARALAGRTLSGTLPNQTTLSTGLGWLRDVDLRPQAAALATPTLLIHGERDPLMPLAAGRWLGEHLPGARLEVFTAAAHAPFLADPARFALLAGDFCQAPALPAKHRVRASFDRAAASYDAAAVLQRQVCERLLAGFDLPAAAATGATGMAPAILDAGCGTGYGARRLRSRWPAAHLTVADFAPAMLDLARDAAAAGCVADIETLPFADQCFDAWWSSLSVQWCDTRRVFAEAARVLRPQGRLAVSTLGPGTFNELRSAFGTVDRYRHTLPFGEPAALGATLQGAGFGGITLHRETLTLHYPDLKTLLRAVKAIGANPVGSGARSGMMGRATWQALQAAYEKQRTPQGLPASYDVILAYAER